MSTTSHKNTHDKDTTHTNKTATQPHTRHASDQKSDSHESKQSANEKHGRQGFASMDPAKQREIAAKGGRASHR